MLSVDFVSVISPPHPPGQPSPDRGGVTYQLIQIPPADGHVAALLVHALGELLRCALAVVAPALLLSCLAVVLGRDAVVGRGGGRAAAEEAADGVADGGADGNTAIVPLALAAEGKQRRDTYAAVLAICPNRPGPADCWGAGAAGLACVGAYVVADRVCCALGAVGARVGTVGREGARPADLLRGIVGEACGCCGGGKELVVVGGGWLMELKLSSDRCGNQ